MSEVDADGYLRDVGSWTRVHATTVAADYGVELTADHWMIVEAARGFYKKTGISPTMRPLVTLARQLDPRLGNSIALAKLFTNQTSKVVAQISGIPKPSDCL